MITFTRSWRGYAAGTSVSTLADTIEALAVAEGAAVYGGVSYPLNSFLDADNRVQAQVDGAGNTFPLTVPGLWANRAALAAAGSTSVFFTDIGIGGSFWFYSGGRWRPQSGRVMLKNSIVDVTNDAAPDIVLDYATILPGLWQDGDILDVFFRKSRTGGTSDTDASLLKFSGAAATPGTPTGLGSGGALTTTTIDMSMRAGLRRLSSTSFRPINIAGAVGVGSGNASPSDVTGYQNMDITTNYLQICSDLTTAGGEISVLRAFTVELIAGA